MRLLNTIALVSVLAVPAMAADSAEFMFGGDAYVAGQTVTLVAEDLDDVFAAGDTVTLRSEISGSAHLAGRAITLEQPVKGDVYGAGMDVDIRADVAGDATLTGYSITITQPVHGDLRVAGKHIELMAPVGGSALLSGDNIEIGALISGDVAVLATSVDWDQGAKIAGTFEVYTDDPENFHIPDSVISADRVTFHNVKDWEDNPTIAGKDLSPKTSIASRFGDFIGGVVIVGLLATLIAAIAPRWVAGLRHEALSDPLRTLWIGFLGLSALFGSVVLLIMTGFGIILVPFAIIGAILLGLAGYVVGAYACGVFTMRMAGREAPENILDRAMAAFVGAFILAVVAAAPLLGWLVGLAVGLIGAGALLIKWFSPSFYRDRT